MDKAGGLEREGAVEGCPGSAGRARAHGGDGGVRRGVGGELAAEAAPADARTRAPADTEPAVEDGEDLPRRVDGVEGSAAGEIPPGRSSYSTMKREQESLDVVACSDDARQVPCLGKLVVISASTGPVMRQAKDRKSTRQRRNSDQGRRWPWKEKRTQKTRVRIPSGQAEQPDQTRPKQSRAMGLSSGWVWEVEVVTCVMPTAGKQGLDEYGRMSG